MAVFRLVILFTVFSVTEAGKITTDKFSRCPRSLQFDGQLLGLISGRSALDCVARCSQISGCLGINVCPSGIDKEVKCSFISEYHPGGCDNLTVASSSQCFFMQKPEPPEETTTTTPTTEATTAEAETTELVCQNGGSPNVDRCDCTPQYSGRKCERLVRDCSEVYENGHTESSNDGIYDIQPITAPAPFQVSCEFAYDVGITYAYFRTQSSDFNKNWAELRDGFGDPANRNAFFTGLENMHHLLSQGGYELHIYFWHGGSAGSAFYDNFTIASEAEFYRLSYDQFRPSGARPADDGFDLSQPVLFSAWGNDHNNCASTSDHSGWFGVGCTSRNGLFAYTLQWPVPGSGMTDVDGLEFNLVRMTPFND
ncbi:hypothetical protein BaRGS_00012032 [Batillaria attramentaria]|uniref:Fibrinogen C-terminal domain-containing protein n=1 Tax=Batillaria attramentaria TaxID=370345 RepID=A0ABD0LB75_9CAEN